MEDVAALKQSMAEFRLQTTKNYERLVSIILQNREKRSVGKEPKDGSDLQLPTNTTGFAEEGGRFLQELQERRIREERALQELQEKRRCEEMEVADVKSINRDRQ